MATKHAMGTNPLDTMIPVQTETATPEEEKADEKPDKPRRTFAFEAVLLERALNAAYWRPGETLTALVMRAITTELDRLERERGTPWPKREGPLRSGRPVGS